MPEADKRKAPFKRLSVALIFSTVLGLTAGPASAGPCAEELARFEATVNRSKATPGAGPTARESTGAKLGHQPTPQSVQRAEEQAATDFDALLARARRLDAAGDQAGCMQALADARSRFELR